MRTIINVWVNFLVMHFKKTCDLRRFCIFLFFLISYQAYGEESKIIDALVVDAMKEWKIPGLSISIVLENKTVKTAGYGIKEVGRTDLVNENTLFQIGSLTKTFTAYAISSLIQQGILDWQTPIRSYLPYFLLSDPVATKETSLRDLLLHQTGLPNHPQQPWWRLWWWLNEKQDNLIARLAYVKLTCPFRSCFNYNNMGYVIATQVASSQLKKSWSEICHELILAKVPLSRTYLDHKILFQDANVAIGHIIANDCVNPAKWRNWDHMSGAAGIQSCAADMERWLNFCLSDIPSMKGLLKGEIPMSANGLLGEDNQTLWSIYTHNQNNAKCAYGWFSYSIDGIQIYFHTGLTDGMQSVIAIVPDKKLGMAILTNACPHQGAICLLNSLLDYYLKLNPKNWNQLSKQALEEKYAATSDKKNWINQQRNCFSVCPIPIRQFIGDYYHPAYGILKISMKNDELCIKPENQNAEFLLTHWQNKEFRIHDPCFTFPWLIEFQLSTDNQCVKGFEMPYVGFFEKIDINVSFGFFSP